MQFEEVFRRATQNLASLAETNLVRWQELIHGILSIAFYKRPPSEHQLLVDIVWQTNPRKEVEVSGMAQTIAEHLIEQGQVTGQLMSARRVLRTVLEKHFGSLPQGVLQRIESCEDVQRVEDAIYSAPQIAKLDDLPL